MDFGKGARKCEGGTVGWLYLKFGGDAADKSLLLRLRLRTNEDIGEKIEHGDQYTHTYLQKALYST